MPTDEQLMMRVAEGDMDAFDHLVRRRQQDALNVAYRFLGDRQAAEDAAQEAFLRVLAAAPRYRPTAQFRTYLYRVIWRLCIDLYRKSRPGPLDAAPAQAAAGPGPADVAAADERAAAVRRAVDRLPPRQRMALVLKHFEDMSYEEIAVALDCSPSAVDALLSRARRRLKQELAGLL